MNFDNRVAIVTGGASGIGAATARILAARGARVAIADYNDTDGAKVAAQINDQAGTEIASSHKIDVSDWTDVQRSFAEIDERLGRIDILVNNAGIGLPGKVADVPVEAWRKTISVTLDGVFFCSKAVIPFLRRGGGGAIVNLGSISGLGGDFHLAAYNAAKGGVVNFSRALAIDAIRDNIRVNCVCPGIVDTPAVAVLKTMPDAWDRLVAAHPRGKASTPDEIASVIAFLASDESSAMVGSTVVADGGLTAWTGMPG